MKLSLALKLDILLALSAVCGIILFCLRLCEYI